MLPRARGSVRNGRVPSFSAFDAAFIRGVLPILLHEWQLGRERMAREVKAVRGLKVKASNPVIQFDWTLLREAVPLAVQRAALALVGSVTNSLRTEIRNRLEDGLRSGIGNNEIAASLDDLFTPSRAYTIAATEASRAMHLGEAEYAKESGAAGLEWLASEDACELCLRLNGKRVRWGQAFAVNSGGDPAYRDVMEPPRHPRCMCTAIPWWDR